MNPASAPALVARGLTKRYKNLTAVAGIDLEVGTGECLALLGPNGAGKTTTVEMLEGLTKPDGGTVEIFGQSLAKDRLAILEKVGVLLQETNLYKRYTVRETLRLFASFYQRPVALESLLAKLSLEDKADTQIRKLSGGQKQRVYLGCGLINDPQLLFLDEPTTGLDPQARRATWDLLQGLKAEGRSILLTTHYMEEAEVLADRVAIVDQGKIIAQGTPRQLIREVCGEQVLGLGFADAKTGLPLVADEALRCRITAKLVWFGEAVVRSDEFDVVVPDAASRIEEVFASQTALGVKVKNLELRQGTLEDVFLKLTGRSLRDGK